MKHLSLVMRYEQYLLQNNHLSNDLQRQAIIFLDKIQQYLIIQKKPIISRITDLLFFFSKLISKKKYYLLPVKGLYMWGGVGIGKTWTMDFFYQSINYDRKLRIHLHNFIIYVHEELNQLQGKINPVLILANELKKKIDIICFDEFLVSDITDAVLLGNLINAMFNRGIILVATSNIAPDDLYKNGLQRDIFMPCINQIKIHCHIINMDNNIDYRNQKSNLLNLWYHPLNKETLLKMQIMFKKLTNGKSLNKFCIKINNRYLQTIGAVDNILAIDFNVLCVQNCSKYDYISLSSKFHKVLIFNIPILNDDQLDCIRRFIILIDTFYDRRIKLIVSAETDLFKIYLGTYLQYEYKRCLSRLQDMQSMEYFNLPYLF